MNVRLVDDSFTAMLIGGGLECDGQLFLFTGLQVEAPADDPLGMPCSGTENAFR